MSDIYTITLTGDDDDYASNYLDKYKSNYSSVDLYAYGGDDVIEWRSRNGTWDNDGTDNYTFFLGNGDDVFTNRMRTEDGDSATGYVLRDANVYVDGGYGSDTYIVSTSYENGFDVKTYDTFYGGAGNDTAITGWGDDVLYGGKGNDYLDASFDYSDGDDTIDGGDGDDYLFGGQGTDSLYGGSGDDFINPGGVNTSYEYMETGEGLDTIFLGDYGETYTVSPEGWGGLTASNFVSAGLSAVYMAALYGPLSTATPFGGLFIGAGSNLLVTAIQGLFDASLEEDNVVDTTADSAVFIELVDYDPRYDTIVLPAMELDSISLSAHSSVNGQFDWDLSNENGGEFLRSTFSSDFVGEYWASLQESGAVVTEDLTDLTDSLRAIEEDAMYVFSNSGGTISASQGGQSLLDLSSVGLDMSSFEAILSGSLSDGESMQLTAAALGYTARLDASEHYASGSAMDDLFMVGTSASPSGNYYLSTWEGDDYVSFQFGEGIIYNGGDGSDTIAFDEYQGNSSNTATEGVTVNLSNEGAQTFNGRTEFDSYLIDVENVVGSSFADDLTGNDDDNILVGNGGADVLDGGAGDDIFVVSVAAEGWTVEGGTGINYLSFEKETTSMRHGGGESGIEDLVHSDNQYNNIHGYIFTGEDDYLNGITATDDIAYGGAGNDTIKGGTGSDILYGEEGNDRLYGLWGGVVSPETINDDGNAIYGGEGNDEVAGGYSDDQLYGDEGADTIEGRDGDDYIDGGSGTDTMTGGEGRDTFVIDSRFDVIDDLDHMEHVIMEGYSDYNQSEIDLEIDFLRGLTWMYSEGVDSFETFRDGEGNWNAIVYDSTLDLEGTSGNDTVLTGGGASQIVRSLAGNDKEVEGGGGNDVIFGGAGNDELYGRYKFYGGIEDDYLFGGSGDDRIYGDDDISENIDETGGDDLIDGGDGADHLQGDGGNDVIYGGYRDGEDDYINGGLGDDIIWAESGDFVYAGDGADEVYFTLSDSGGNGNVSLGLTDYDDDVLYVDLTDLEELSDVVKLYVSDVNYGDVIVLMGITDVDDVYKSSVAEGALIRSSDDHHSILQLDWMGTIYESVNEDGFVELGF